MTKKEIIAALQARAEHLDSVIDSMINDNSIGYDIYNHALGRYVEINYILRLIGEKR